MSKIILSHVIDQDNTVGIELMLEPFPQNHSDLVEWEVKAAEVLRMGLNTIFREQIIAATAKHFTDITGLPWPVTPTTARRTFHCG